MKPLKRHASWCVLTSQALVRFCLLITFLIANTARAQDCCGTPGALPPAEPDRLFYGNNLECNDYAPYVYPLGCWGLTEHFYVSNKTANLGFDIGELVYVDLYVWSSECSGQRQRFYGQSVLAEGTSAIYWGAMSVNIENITGAAAHL